MALPGNHIIDWIVRNKFARRIIQSLDKVGGLAITTPVGARIVGALFPSSKPILCSDCFTDEGLRKDAQRVGLKKCASVS